MRFNWVDILSIGLVATAGGVQFMRGSKDISRVFYEAVLLSGAMVASYRLLKPLGQVVDFTPVVTFVGTFVILAGLGIWLAFLLNRLLPFDAGAFNYLFALLLAVACGWVLGHGVLRALYLALAEKDPEFIVAVRRSWMASQLLYFGALYELLVVLRFARHSQF